MIETNWGSKQLCLLLKNLKPKISLIFKHPNLWICSFLLIERLCLRKLPKKLCDKEHLAGRSHLSLCAVLQCHSPPAVSACSALPTWVLQNHSSLSGQNFSLSASGPSMFKREKKRKKNFFLCHVSHYRLETDTETSERLWKLWVSRLVTGWECQGVCAPVHHVYIGVSGGAWDNGPLSVRHCSAIRYSVS